MQRLGAGPQGASTEPGGARDFAGDATEPGPGEEAASPAGAGTLYEPARLGRYALLEQIGAGAMGVVYSAFDQSLDRKVAIKLVHPQRAQAAPAAARDRFIREAKAMARVSDAHVVHVYEASEIDGRVFLVMEFVEGTTLTQWLAGREPGRWREVLQMFRAIARGLAAAHDAGVIHRDFKPDNVLVTAAGSPKIADFGLAGLEGPSRDPEVRERSAEARTLTATGATMGTPMYMSPEQYAGHRIDARSDQFSFSIALYAALFGQHPFEGDTFAALATHVIEGDMREPSAHGVPTRIRRAVVRGLANRPEDRWPTMLHLAAALEDRTPGRRAWWLAGGTIAAASLGAYMAARSSARVEPCTAAEAALTGIWDEATKTAVDRRFHDGVAESPDSRAWSQLRSRIDEHAEAWVHASAEGCRSHQAGTLSDALYDRRQACLEVVLRRLRGLTTSLSTIEGAWIDHAADLAPDPGELGACLDDVSLTAGPPPPPAGAARDRWLDAREALGRAETAMDLERTHAAEAALLEVGELDDPDATATVLRLQGRLAQRRGDPAAAADLLARSAAAADTARNDLARARALVELVWNLGVEQYLPAEAERVGQQARGALARAGDPPALVSELESGLGMTAMFAGRFDDAVAHMQSALALAADDALTSPQSAVLHGNLGSAELRRGRHDVAVDHLRRASDLLDASLGPEHPRSVQILNNLGVALAQAGRHEEALAVHRRSLAGRESLHGADHRDTANAWNGVGLALHELGRTDEAIGALERSLSIRQATGGRDEDLAEARFGLARAVERRDPARARSLAQLALELYGAPHLVAASARETATIRAFIAKTDPDPDPDDGGGDP